MAALVEVPVASSVTRRRDAIVAAARKQFIASGFHGTSMDVVAQEAGVSRRTVFNLFKTKAALFEAVVEHLWTSLTITREGDWAEVTDPRVGLTRLATEIVEFWADPGSVGMLTMVIAESLRSPDILEEFTRAGKQPAFRATVRYLEKLNASGILDIAEPTLAANQLIGLLNEPLLWSQVLGLTKRPSREKRETVIRSAVDVFLAAYHGKRAVLE